MNLNSKYFDSIRVKPEEDRSLRNELPQCEWAGCAKPAQHPAPKGRGRDGEYFHFCLDHVRQYNKTYNYFSGMSDDEVSEFKVGSLTGHRPTWSLGVNTSGKVSQGAEDSDKPSGYKYGFGVNDPFELFEMSAKQENAQAEKPRRPLRKLERKSLLALNLPDWVEKDEIKARFKDLVKRHHPDSNGGDKGSEDRLREIIQAYNYLKQAGRC